MSIFDLSSSPAKTKPKPKVGSKEKERKANKKKTNKKQNTQKKACRSEQGQIEKQTAVKETLLKSDINRANMPDLECSWLMQNDYLKNSFFYLTITEVMHLKLK